MVDSNTHRFAANVVESRLSAVRAVNCHAPFWDLIHVPDDSSREIFKENVSRESDPNKVFHSSKWEPWVFAVYPGIGVGGKKYLVNPTSEQAPVQQVIQQTHKLGVAAVP